MVPILSHLRVFELKKVSHLKVLTRDGYFELKIEEKLNSSNFELSQSYMHVTTSPSMTFLSYLKVPVTISRVDCSKPAFQISVYENFRLLNGLRIGLLELSLLVIVGGIQ